MFARSQLTAVEDAGEAEEGRRGLISPAEWPVLVGGTALPAADGGSHGARGAAAAVEVASEESWRKTTSEVGAPAEPASPLDRTPATGYSTPPPGSRCPHRSISIAAAAAAELQALGHKPI
ncbi:unnamed protein product [Urochloa humidicola]